MNPIFKGAIAFGTVTGVGGTSYGIYNAIQTNPQKVKTYAEELEGTLLTATGDTNQNEWKARLASLQEIDSEEKLVLGLKGLKNKGEANQWEELRNWCKDIVKNSSKGREDQEFQNIQSYCTFSTKEKIVNPIDEKATEDDAKWLAGHTELSKIAIKDLDNELKTAKEKNADKDKKVAIKNWCTATYKKPYKGPNDKDFKNASRICKTTV